jgi:hypothetical protein
MKEIWRKIEGFSNYEVSSEGRVRNVETGKVLRSMIAKDGYHRIGLYLKGKPKSHLIHRLVATTFIPNPESKKEVNHINGCKADNRVENLEWSTRSENAFHAYKTGLTNGRPKQRVRCAETGQEFDSQLIASKYFGCNVGSIQVSIHKGYKVKGKYHFELI